MVGTTIWFVAFRRATDEIKLALTYRIRTVVLGTVNVVEPNIARCPALTMIHILSDRTL